MNVKSTAAGVGAALALVGGPTTVALLSAAPAQAEPAVCAEDNVNANRKAAIGCAGYTFTPDGSDDTPSMESEPWRVPFRMEYDPDGTRFPGAQRDWSGNFAIIPVDE